MSVPNPQSPTPHPPSAAVTGQHLTFTELGDRPSSQARPVLDILRPPQDGSPLPPANPLHHVRARVTVCVGTAELTVGDLLGAKEHQVVRLDQSLDQPVEVLLEGQVIARGTLVAVGEHFGVRITELPLPLKP